MRSLLIVLLCLFTTSVSAHPAAHEHLHFISETTLAGIGLFVLLVVAFAGFKKLKSKKAKEV